MARRPAPLCQRRQRSQHRLGTTSNKMLRRFVSFEQLRDEPVKAETAIVRRQMNLGPRCAEILDTGRQLRRTYPVVERHPPRRLPRRPATITATAQQLADVRQERRLPDPACRQSDMIEIVEVGKAIAERPPGIDLVTW